MFAKLITKSTEVKQRAMIQPVPLSSLGMFSLSFSFPVFCRSIIALQSVVLLVQINVLKERLFDFFAKAV